MSRYSKALFFTIVVVFLLYAISFIIRTSFVIDGERYYCLFDDAMISMRYAKNLAAGYGLVWNPGGERVEGFTNLLWVIIMAGIHLFPIPPSKVSLVVQLISALILLINLLVIKKLAELISDGSPFVVLGSVFLTAFYLPLINWSLQGMEVGLLSLIISTACLSALNYIKKLNSLIWIYTLLGIGLLVRLDMVTIYISVLIFFILFDDANKIKHLLYGLLILAIFIIPQTLFRLWYFNDILPNTYYLKMTGFPVLYRISRGLLTFTKFINQLDLLLLFILAYFVARFLIRQKSFLFLVWIFFTQILYHIYVGGDAWESWGSRYIVIVMPVFFLILTNSLHNGFLTYLKLEGNKINSWNIIIISIIIITLYLLNLNTVKGSLINFILLNRPLHVDDHVIMVKKSILIKKITTENARIAVVWAGIIPYFADRYSIDLLGKNDRIIAYQKMRIASGWKKFICFYPGHLKWDYRYSIGQLKPDVVVQVWKGGTLSPLGTLEALEVLEHNYKEYLTGIKKQGEASEVKWFLLKESPNIKNNNS